MPSILQFSGYMVQIQLRCEQAHPALYKLSLVSFFGSIRETSSTWQYSPPCFLHTPDRVKYGKKCWEHRSKLCHQPKSRSLVLLCTFPEPLVNWQPLRISCCLCQGLQPTWRALKPISDSIDGIIPTLLRLLLQDKQRCQPHHVFFFQHHSPMHCRVSSKCLFSLERSLLESDTVKLEPFQKKCAQLGKTIHPQKQRLAFLCNHNKIKVPCQFSLSFLNDCAVCRSAGLYQHLRSAHNWLPCLWSVLLLSYASAWKISYCLCTPKHRHRLYKICKICVPAYLWALSP